MMQESSSGPSSSHLSEMIVQLSIDNQIIPVKRATLCHFKDTLFAKRFNDSKWMLEHMFKSKDGTSVVLMELPTAIIKPIINQLRLAAMLNVTCSGDELPNMKIDDEQDVEVLDLVVSKVFPDYYCCSYWRDV